MSGHRNDNEKLGGEEQLRLISAERAQAEQRADERELREANRASRRSHHGSYAARLFEEAFQSYVFQSMRSLMSRSTRAVAAEEAVTMA